MSKLKLSPPPRTIRYKLSFYESGYLMASIPRDKLDRMRVECPALWLQLQISFHKAYALSDGHSMQKEAKIKVREYTKLLKIIFKK